MATEGSWPSIQARGLLSTSSLLDVYGVDSPTRARILGAHRPQSVTIKAEGLPPATIRDQKPMSDGALQKCLDDGLSPREWYEILNSKAFFWLSRARLNRLLGARAYRKSPQVVLTLDTASIVASHEKMISLSPINSGATIFNAQPRGLATFKPIAKYPFDDWKAKRGVRDAVVELVVEGGVPDITKHVLAVHEVYEQKSRRLWKAERADETEGPYDM
mgnify:CR=1 FL=1